MTCAFTTNFSHVNSCIYVCASDFLFVTIYISSLPEKASTRDHQLTTVPCELTPSYARKFPYLITPSNLLPSSSAFPLPWQTILSLYRTTDYLVPAVRDLSTFNFFLLDYRLAPLTPSAATLLLLILLPTHTQSMLSSSILLTLRLLS